MSVRVAMGAMMQHQMQASIKECDLAARSPSGGQEQPRARFGEVPAAADAVIQRATAKLPADRYQTVEELMAEFEAALQADKISTVVKPGSATVVTTAEARNPYKGLRAFTEADSADFYGRERLVDRLVEVLGRSGTAGRIAAVVGPSGIGKSSVVRGGFGICIASAISVCPRNLSPAK